MKIVEAKCPGCGANVKFSEDAKKGICDYCKKEFLIEKDPNEEYLLSINELKMKSFKRASLMQKIIITMTLIVMLTIVGAFIISMWSENIDKPLENINNISNHSYKFIDSSSTRAIDKLTSGDFDYQTVGDIQRVKEYLLTNKENSVYIPIYKVVYTDWPNKENRFVLYIPVRYDNVLRNGKDIDVINLGNGKIDCDDYYFNLEHSSSSKGYQSLEDVYEKYIKANKNDYNLLEK